MSAKQAKKSQSKMSADLSMGANALEEFILNNIKGIIAIVGICALLFAAYGVGRYISKQKYMEGLSDIYKFQKTTWKDYQDKKITLDEFSQKWKGLIDQVGDNEGIVTLLDEVQKKFATEGELQKAKELLAPYYEQVKGTPYIGYFIGLRLAVIEEDLGNYQDAINILEKIVTSPTKFLESRLYFDLGRLYDQLGNKEKAKANFQYVLDYFPNDSIVNETKLFMKNL